VRLADRILPEEIAELQAPARAPRSLPAHQLQLGDRCIYFFKLDRYVRYRVATEFLADGTPVPFEARRVRKFGRADLQGNPGRRKSGRRPAAEVSGGR
jgi:hypothetical protein